MRSFALALGVLAATSPAQDGKPNDSEDWRKLEAQLAEPMLRDFAIAAMAEIGPRAIASLIASIDIEQPAKTRRLLYAISELAHHATEAYPRLEQLGRDCAPSLAVAFLEVQVAIVPFFGEAEWNSALARIGAWGMELGELEDPQLELRFARAFEQAGRLTRSPRFHRDSTVQTLIRVIQAAPDQGARHAAARLLGQRVEDRDVGDAIPELLACMRQAPSSYRAQTMWAPDRRLRFETLPEDRRWPAVALTRIAPGTESAVEAHGYLTRHGNPLEFRRAVDTIREHRDIAERAVPHCIAALRQDGARPRTPQQRGDLVVTLGILGPAAKDAAPTLQSLASGEDEGLAALARSALRSIER